MRIDGELRREAALLAATSVGWRRTAEFVSNAQDLTTGLEHITASAVVIDRRRHVVLLVFHTQLLTWLKPGGHLQAGEMPWQAAARELQEETAARVRLPDNPRSQLVDIEVHEAVGVDGRRHIHHDFCFGFMASALDAPIAPSEEVVAVAWVQLDQLALLGVPDNVTSAIALALSHRQPGGA